MSRLCSALTGAAVVAIALVGFAGHASAVELPAKAAAEIPAVDWQHGQMLVCGATCHVAQASTLVAAGVAHADDPALARALAADPSSAALPRTTTRPAGPSCVASMPGLCFPTAASELSASAGNWSWI